ncbi:hypothetical protein ACTMU2_11700 [Cupriavidus basilensis]
MNQLNTASLPPWARFDVGARGYRTRIAGRHHHLPRQRAQSCLTATIASGDHLPRRLLASRAAHGDAVRHGLTSEPPVRRLTAHQRPRGDQTMWTGPWILARPPPRYLAARIRPRNCRHSGTRRSRRMLRTSPQLLATAVAQYGSPAERDLAARVAQQRCRLAHRADGARRAGRGIFYGAKVNKSQALVKAAVMAGRGHRCLQPPRAARRPCGPAPTRCKRVRHRTGQDSGVP